MGQITTWGSKMFIGLMTDTERQAQNRWDAWVLDAYSWGDLSLHVWSTIAAGRACIDSGLSIYGNRHQDELLMASMGY